MPVPRVHLEALKDISLNRGKKDSRISWLSKIAESIISSSKANIIESAVHFTRPILFLLNSHSFPCLVINAAVINKFGCQTSDWFQQ